MSEGKNLKWYDLEERTLNFAKRVRAFVKLLPNTISNVEDVQQLIKASDSVGANYIEANEGLGKKDFVMHVKICRKEARVAIGCSSWTVAKVSWPGKSMSG